MLKKFESKDNNKSIVINLRINKELNENFNKLLEKFGANKSEFIRFLIEREIEMEGIVNDK